MLFQSYLIGRKQVVNVDGFFSSGVMVTSVVPHVLDPLLSIILINYVKDSVQHSEYFLFRDDLKLFSVSSID